MIRKVTSVLACLALIGVLSVTARADDGAAATTAKEGKGNVSENPKVLMKTNKGDLVVECYPDKAPITVANFLQYTRDGFYDGTVFHRVIPGFVIQGGGFTADLNRKETRDAIKNEASNGLKNLRGTLSMARTPDINSATSQFFVNLVDNKSLDHRDTSARGYGYAVFAKVTEGMDVVDEIAKVQTTMKKGLSDVPAEAIVIEKATVVGESEGK
jgi:cyclophilin family peptidyl-prolyl cis-trans isomerase